MKIPLSWITEFVAVSLDNEEIAETLTMAGLEVDGIHQEGSETIFDISLTPNLVHCMSALGVARELSAQTNTPIHLPQHNVVEDENISIEKKVKVNVKNKEAAPRYACRLIKDVQVGPSPDWLVQRLAACGMRSINNIVDITNYVLMEYGQPLHAFDFDLLSGGQIIVRNATDGMLFTTLDGIERSLSENMLLICDESKPVAIAGVMGGQNAEVSSRTTNVLLESAYFHPSSIRKTSKMLGLSTEASKRFERGADPCQVILSLDRAASLIKELGDGRVAKGVIDVKEREFKPRTITCRFKRINDVLGTSLSFGEIEEILKRLDCPLTFEGQDVLHVQVPTYRGDLYNEIDLIEEVARVYGYNNIPKSSAPHSDSVHPHSAAFLFDREARSRLVSLGLQEFLTCDLISPKEITYLPEDLTPKSGIIHVMNPSSIEQSVLRPSLLPGLLQVIKHNLNHQVQDINGFEVGKVHFKYEDRYIEHTHAAIILSGKNSPHYWKEKAQEDDFFNLKGYIENFLESLSIPTPTFEVSSFSLLHPGRQASVFIGKEKVGILGEVHPSILRKMDISHRVLFAEIDLHDLFQIEKKDEKMKSLPLYPASQRDWTITVKENIKIQDIFSFINTLESKILENVSLQSIYTSDKLGSDLQNVTFRFIYRDKEKTLSFEEVENEHTRIIKAVGQKI